MASDEQKPVAEPRTDDDVPDLHCLQIDLLRQAVEIYLRLAYPAGDPPEVVRRRLEWPPQVAPSMLLTRPPFERATRPGINRPSVFALRLGNACYPHMKLQIQPWPNPAGFMLSVNTHDQALALEHNAEGAEPFRALQAENQRLKEAIELEWDRAGLPTFLRYLRDYIDSHSRAGQSPGPVQG